MQNNYVRLLFIFFKEDKFSLQAAMCNGFACTPVDTKCKMDCF